MDEFLKVVMYPALIGMGSLVLWLVKFYIPAQQKIRDAEHQAKIEQQGKEWESRLDEQKKRLDAALEEKKDQREYHQQAGNVAIEVLERIMGEAISERSREVDELRKEMRQYNKNVEILATKVGDLSGSVRQLSGVIGDLKAKIMDAPRR